MDKVIRILTWTVFGVGFVLVVLVSLLASLTGRAAFAQQPPPNTTKSKVKVNVPQDDAELSIEGKPTRTVGKTREYDTPDLEPGKKYLYEFKVSWKPDKFTTRTRTRTVRFVAGEEVAVDLTVAQPTDTADVLLKAMTDDVLKDMVDAAKVTKDDVAFEPKTADARVLVAAVKAGAKRAVGVQQDADKVKAAKAQVKKAELEGKIDVQQLDPAECKDYAEATVVFLYAGEEANLLLRPVLLKELKAGTRVVSYRFGMGDWTPTATRKGTNADGEEYDLHTWTVTDADKQKYGKK
jgi:uncharacterized protein (TIGR03000 family)